MQKGQSFILQGYCKSHSDMKLLFLYFKVLVGKNRHDCTPLMILLITVKALSNDLINKLLTQYMISYLIKLFSISAVLGYATTIIPRSVTYYVSSFLFAVFGLKMLKEGNI